MTQRIPLDHLNSDQYDQLCNELDRARARADRLAVDLTGWRNLAAEHQQETIAALERAEHAEAAAERARAAAECFLHEYEDGTDPCAAAVLAALTAPARETT